MSRRPPSLADVDAVFEALSHAARRHILLMLSHSGELPSGYLAARFHHSWPTTTRHLGVLEKAGLVVVRRVGRASEYGLDRERLRDVVGGWLDHLEPPTPTRKWRPTGARTTRELSHRKTHTKGRKR